MPSTSNLATEIFPGVEANVIVIRNPGLEEHSHPPDQEASETEIVRKKASPRMFLQIFTILGICTRARGNNANVAENSEAAFPFVYAFLSGKETAQYATVLQSMVTAA
ncbi:hypothetical protein QAD02_023260 [Eretmocerus hayati]|uniref:Uncharacterized protein n=1 Tax=Eretmocerus hayati TaxID=131215 RepID=A0ACC2PWZ0_9HYME|nr:hypothetical protein QAD02_023260 [Eretmocerus hayati]